MANEDMTTPQSEGPGFFDTVWNVTKDTAQTGGQIISNAHPAGSLVMLPFGIKPDSIRQQQEAEQFQSKQRLAWEYDQARKKKEDERADQRWKWETEARPMVEEAAQRELRQQRVAAGKSAYDRFSATSKSAVGRLLGELDPETTDADIAETLNSEAARDFMDFNTYGVMLMNQDPAVREYAIEQARASGVDISEVDGKYYLSAKGLEKSIEATPQALSLMRDEAQRKVADQLAAVRVRRERQAHVMGYTQNRRTDDLLRLGHDLPSAMRDEQAFSKAFSPHETRVNSVWKSLTDIFEDGKMTAEEKQEYAPQLMYLAKQMNVPYTETTDGQILINGTPAKEYAAGQLANDPVEIAWKNRVTAYQDRSAAIVAAEAAKRGKKAPGAEAEEAGMPNAPLLQAMYGTRYFEADDKTQSKLDAGTAEFTVLAANQRYRDKDGNLKKDLPTLKALDRAWNVRMRSLGIDADEYESPVYTQIQETELLDLEQKLKIMQNAAQGFTKQMKREGHKTNAEKGYVESIGDKAAQANELLLAGLPAAQSAAAQADRQRNARTLREGDLAREIKTLQNEIEKRRKILQAKENR